MDDPTRPPPPPRSQQRRRDSDRSLVRNPTRAAWTTPERLQRRFSLKPTEGQGRLRRDGARIDFRDDEGTYAVSGTVTGAAVVRPWPQWATLVLWMAFAVCVTVGMDMWFGRAPDDGVLLGVVLGVIFAYQWVRTPFVRIDGINDAGEPIVLHLHLKPSDSFRPGADAEALAETLRSAAREAWMSRDT